MKAILVPVEQHSLIRSVLDAALLVAGRFGSHVEGLALGPDIPDVIAFDVPVGWTILSEKEQRELVERSRHIFEEFMLSCAVPRRAEAPDETSCGWLGQHLFGDSYIGSFGRVFKARQLSTGQMVAVKLLRLPPDATASDHQTRASRFRREMRLCASLSHPCPWPLAPK